MGAVGVSSSSCTGGQGRAGDPLYKGTPDAAHRPDLLTGKQRARLKELFANDEHTLVEVTWWIYQKMVAAYRHRDRAQGKILMQELITSTACGVPPELSEVTTLGRTLHTRATDVLAYLNRPRTSNGPTQGAQRPPGTPTRHRAGLSQPHQLHHPLTTRSRRIQAPPTPSIGKSPSTRSATHLAQVQ